MADDAITFIKAKGLEQVDLLGFSMGGMIAQEIVLKEPNLVRKMILAGTGPAGGEGISTVARVANYDLLRGFFTGQDPKQFLFGVRLEDGRQLRNAERASQQPADGFQARVSRLQGQCGRRCHHGLCSHPCRLGKVRPEGTAC